MCGQGPERDDGGQVLGKDIEGRGQKSDREGLSLETVTGGQDREKGTRCPGTNVACQIDAVGLQSRREDHLSETRNLWGCTGE